MPRMQAPGTQLKWTLPSPRLGGLPPQAGCFASLTQLVRGNLRTVTCSHDRTRAFSSVTPETAHFLSEDCKLNPDGDQPDMEGNTPAACSVCSTSAWMSALLCPRPSPRDTAQSPTPPARLALGVLPQLETSPHEGKKMQVKVTQPCATLCNPMDCSPPGQNTGVVAMPSSRVLSDPGIEPRSPALQVDSLPSEPPGKGPKLPGRHIGQQPGLPSRLNS